MCAHKETMKSEPYYCGKGKLCIDVICTLCWKIIQVITVR